MCDLIFSILQCSNALCYVLFCEPINTITVKIIISMFTCQNKLPMPATKQFAYIC